MPAGLVCHVCPENFLFQYLQSLINLPSSKAWTRFCKGHDWLSATEVWDRPRDESQVTTENYFSKNPSFVFKFEETEIDDHECIC